MELPNYTVIFDSECLLCNYTVRFLIKRDKRKILWFANTQSKAIQDILNSEQLQHSVQFYMNNTFYKESTAVLKIFRVLSFPYSLLYIFIVIPPPLRNLAYKIVASIRYKISRLFPLSCYIPPELRARLLS